MQPKAVILDFDGVIVDSLPVHLDAWRAAVVAVFKVPLKDPTALIGHATRTIAHKLAREYGDATRADELVYRKRALLEVRYADLPLFPGVRDMLAEARSRGLPLGIASNSPRAFVTGALHALQIDVKVVVAGDDVSRGKPHPGIFWDCGNQLGIAPSERPATLVFEDSFHGLAAAKAAGMVPIGVASAHTPEALLNASARAVCEHLAEALQNLWLDAFPD